MGNHETSYPFHPFSGQGEPEFEHHREDPFNRSFGVPDLDLIHGRAEEIPKQEIRLHLDPPSTTPSLAKPNPLVTTTVRPHRCVTHGVDSGPVGVVLFDSSIGSGVFDRSRRVSNWIAATDESSVTIRGLNHPDRWVRSAVRSYMSFLPFAWLIRSRYDARPSRLSGP